MLFYNLLSGENPIFRGSYGVPHGGFFASSAHFGSALSYPSNPPYLDKTIRESTSQHPITPLKTSQCARAGSFVSKEKQSSQVSFCLVHLQWWAVCGSSESQSQYEVS